AFLASAVVPKIYMQHIWHTVTKVKESTFYEFKQANKKCLVNVDVFRQALDICLRVLGKEFIVPPSEEELLTFLVGLASIINKCLSGKIISNDRLHQSRVAIIWGMFHKKTTRWLHTIKDDGVLSQMKFVKIREDIQEYGRAIPDAMLTDDIKQFETYHMFIKYSTGLIPLKKTRGKESQGKKVVVSLKPASDEESNESDAKPARK
ncbi:hypothetical protein Tco_0570354, partial [Tanacetum coccineum]